MKHDAQTAIRGNDFDQLKTRNDIDELKTRIGDLEKDNSLLIQEVARAKELVRNLHAEMRVREAATIARIDAAIEGLENAMNTYPEPMDERSNKT